MKSGSLGDKCKVTSGAHCVWHSSTIVCTYPLNLPLCVWQSSNTVRVNVCMHEEVCECMNVRVSDFECLCVCLCMCGCVYIFLNLPPTSVMQVGDIKMNKKNF